MHWIHLRHQFIEGSRRFEVAGETDAPWPLWLVGEKGVAKIGLSVHGESLQAADRLARQRAAELEQLFPEAQIKTLRTWPQMEFGDFVPRGASPGTPYKSLPR
jgi:hypothetical protein